MHSLMQRQPAGSPRTMDYYSWIFTHAEGRSRGSHSKSRRRPLREVPRSVPAGSILPPAGTKPPLTHLSLYLVFSMPESPLFLSINITHYSRLV